MITEAMPPQSITDQLPYSEPFLFVDRLLSVADDGVVGEYTFPEDAFFYKGHFKDHPVTPGAILTECMAQIGVVCLGVHLLHDGPSDIEGQVALTSSSIEYYKNVYPGETVIVSSRKKYFRFNKLKCNVTMRNRADQIVAKGTIAGVVIPK